MPDLSKIRLYRMTNVGNIGHILQHGIVHRNSSHANPDFTPIGDGSLIATRDGHALPDGTKLGDYIPFYFGPRMPMLYVIQNGFNGVKLTAAEDVIYCLTNVQQILDHDLDFIFTNGHAINSLSSIYSRVDVEDIENIVDIAAVKVMHWKDEKDQDLKRRKEAEFLVRSDIPRTAITGFVVYNENVKRKLQDFGAEADRVVVRKDFYF